MNGKKMPHFLKKNPLPDWIELWNQSSNLFWKKFWIAKTNGNLPAGFGYDNHGGKKGK